MSQTITPYLFYEDVDAAIGFLARAFGFEEVLRFTGEEGYVNHAEMRLGGDSIMLGTPGDDFRNPKRLGQATIGIHVYVDDVDAHYERAKAAGAEIVLEPTDQEYGDRRYDATDLEGHRWYFAQQVRQVAPEEWGAQVSARG
jgi:PhnB protein